MAGTGTTAWDMSPSSSGGNASDVGGNPGLSLVLSPVLMMGPEPSGDVYITVPFGTLRNWVRKTLLLRRIVFMLVLPKSLLNVDHLQDRQVLMDSI